SSRSLPRCARARASRSAAIAAESKIPVSSRAALSVAVSMAQGDTGANTFDATLFDHEILLVNHFGPARDLGLDELRKLLGRGRHRFEHLRHHKPRLERRIGEDFPYLGVDLHHHLARRAAGRGEAEPGVGLVAGDAAFADSRRIWQR